MRWLYCTPLSHAPHTYTHSVCLMTPRGSCCGNPGLAFIFAHSRQTLSAYFPLQPLFQLLAVGCLATPQAWVPYWCAPLWCPSCVRCSGGAAQWHWPPARTISMCSSAAPLTRYAAYRTRSAFSVVLWPDQGKRASTAQAVFLLNGHLGCPAKHA